MVDFQERDTKRGLGTDDDEEDETPDTDERAEPEGGSGTTAGGGTQTSPVHDDHDHHHAVEDLQAAVVTVSSSRSLEEDTSGDAIVDAFEAEGHAVVTRELVTDDHDRIQTVLDALVRREDVDTVVTTGGTGVTPDDVTVEAVRPLFDKSLPGFGEVFRRRSYEDIGTRVIATRAAAGVVDGVPVFCLPGSEHGARLGAEEIIVPEAPHLAGMARRDEGGDEHDHPH